MRKVVLYIATSLDGYVADKAGAVAWLGGDDSEPENFGSYPQFIETVDTVILGYSTYHQIVTELSPEKWAYEGKQSYVLTHRECENTEEIIFTDRDISELIEELRATEGKDIWICGGASIVNQMLEKNLIDEFTISVIPTILGDGIKLFSNHSIEQKLKLISTRNYNGIVDLVYIQRK